MVQCSRRPAVDGIHIDLNTGLQDSMRQLGLGSSSEGRLYPERPGEQDCSYFIRTGYCGYGVKCRYNHPRDHGAASNAVGASEYPEHVGQPVCQYFLKTGNCRFGSSCKYRHLQGVSVSLNYYGYPLRQGEKECSYYVKTGQCKFGSACKFHHPPPVSSSVTSPAPEVYQMVQPPLVPPPQQYPYLASWQVGGPSISTTSYTPGSYGPVFISPSTVPVPDWSPYLPPVSPRVCPAGQQIVQAGLSYGSLYQSHPSTSAHPGPCHPVSSSAGPLGIHHNGYKLPERPGQPICQYYMKSGVCKFGTKCKYHHPPAWRTPYSNYIFSPLGLPLRPGAQPCSDYAQHGVCKFGLMCKYDHPVGTLSYSPSASSLSDMPVAPYPVGFPLATVAPSASYPELQP